MARGDLRAELLGSFPVAVQLAPGVTPPDALGDQETRRVHRRDRNAMVIRQPAQDVQILADRVHGAHALDPVVPEARRRLEGIGRPLGEDRGGGQRHLPTGVRRYVAHGTSFAPRTVLSFPVSPASERGIREILPAPPMRTPGATGPPPPRRPLPP